MAAEFPAASYEQWRTLAQAAIEGARYEDRLQSHTADGLTVEPLYRRAQTASLVPGRAPGARWQVLQRIDHPDPAAARAQAIEDIDGGANTFFLPDRCDAYVTVTYLPHARKEDVCAEVEEHVRRAAQVDPWLSKSWVSAPEEDSLASLGQGHFFWMRAMEEKGCPPMTMLQAATKNIAVAYKKDKALGTLEKGKIADLVILNQDPLQAAENYRSIHMVLKDGALVDRDALPEKAILTAPLDLPAEEEAVYVAAVPSGPRLPMCPMCMCR